MSGDKVENFGPPRYPGDTRPPFAPGNLAGVRSGAWSPRLIAETVEELRPDLQSIVDAAPWIAALDRHALEDYLLDRARLARLESWLAEKGERDDKGNLRERDLREVSTLRRRCMDHRARLGLDPLSRVRLERDVAVGAAYQEHAIDALKAEGRRVVESREIDRTAEQEDDR